MTLLNQNGMFTMPKTAVVTGASATTTDVKELALIKQHLDAFEPVSAEYVAFDINVTGIMAGGTVVTAYFYRQNNEATDVLIDTQTATLGAKTDGLISSVLTSSVINRATKVKVKVAYIQGAAAYSADCFITLLDKKAENYITRGGSLADATVTLTAASAAVSAALTAHVQLVGVDGVNIAAGQVVDVYLSSDNAGSTTSLSKTFAVLTSAGTLINTITSTQALQVKTNAAGLVDVAVTLSAVGTAYLNVVIPGEKVVTSTVLTWA